MKNLKFVLFFFLILLLCSCSPVIQKNGNNLKEDEPIAIERKPSGEAESRAPVFVYNNQSAKLPKNLFLALNDKPQLLADGYAKLIGVVLGSSCGVALVEMGGQERCLRQGEDWGEYRVASITGKGIKLVRKEK